MEASPPIGDTAAGSAVLGFRQKPLHPLLRRWRIRLLHRLSNRPPNSQRIYLVRLKDRRYKRIVFSDSYQAARAGAQLQRFGDARIYPRVILQRENELWVEFVEGRPFQAGDAAELERLADLFAVLYTREPELRPVERTPHAHGLHTDLGFLRDAGVISGGVHRVLSEVAERETPKEVWVGHDCTDAILKNFVVEPGGRVVAVDVESLGAEQLLGSGVAKASVRWLGPRTPLFLEALRRRAVPDFQTYFPFVEMCFVAFWLKSSFLEKKRRFVDPRLFDRFLGG